MSTHTILCINDQEKEIRDFSRILREEGYYILTARNAEEILEELKGNSINLIISNQEMKGTSIKELLERAGKSYSPLMCIFLIDKEGVDERIIAESENGMYWFLAKPWMREDLISTIRHALRYGDLLSQNEALRESVNVLAAKDFTFEEKVQKTLTISLTLIGAEKGSIMLRDEQGDLIVKAASNKRLIGIKKCLEDDKSVSAWVVKNGKSLFVGNVKEDPRFKPSEEALYKTDNFLCIPIKNKNGAVVGVFNATDKRDGRAFTKEDENILSVFISKIVMLIENAQLEEELEKERRRLKRRNEELLVLEQVRDDLINMIIHDLKGPLGEVMANLDLLSYVQLESQDRECLDTAIQGSESLLRMILNLLDVRRMEEGKLQLHCETFEVAECIEGTVKKLKTLIKQKEIEIKVVIDEKVSTWIADRSLIERVLNNLLINAIEYCYRGGKVEIISRYHHEEKQLRVEVNDNGKGIPKEFHQKIFERFTQVDRGGAKRKHSTGLGLTFCKMAIEAHQGKIWVESEAGKGSTFIFLLPLSHLIDLT
jgi:two-component system sensor histidine kinase KdpD